MGAGVPTRWPLTRREPLCGTDRKAIPERSEALDARSEASEPHRCAQVLYPRKHFHPRTGFGLDRSRSAPLSIRAPVAGDGAT